MTLVQDALPVPWQPHSSWGMVLTEPNVAHSVAFSGFLSFFLFGRHGVCVRVRSPWATDVRVTLQTWTTWPRGHWRRLGTPDPEGEANAPIRLNPPPLGAETPMNISDRISLSSAALLRTGPLGAAALES